MGHDGWGGGPMTDLLLRNRSARLHLQMSGILSYGGMLRRQLYLGAVRIIGM